MVESKNNIKTNGKILLIALNSIKSNPNQPRRNFDEKELKSLSESIKVNGVLQPITVRALDDENYELIAGERRLRATKMAGFEFIPCIEIDVESEQSAVLALIENIQRENLGYFEEAEGIARLMVHLGLRQDEVAVKLGKAQSTLSNKLRLLKLHPTLRKRIASENLTERHARALLKLTNFDDQSKVLDTIIRKKLNVKQTDNLIQNFNKPKIVKRHANSIIIKDVRIFSNTINHAVDTMKKSGINAVSQKNETDEFIEYYVRIDKQLEFQQSYA